MKWSSIGLAMQKHADMTAAWMSVEENGAVRAGVGTASEYHQSVFRDAGGLHETAGFLSTRSRRESLR